MRTWWLGVEGRSAVTGVESVLSEEKVKRGRGRVEEETLWPTSPRSPERPRLRRWWQKRQLFPMAMYTCTPLLHGLLVVKMEGLRKG